MKRIIPLFTLSLICLPSCSGINDTPVPWDIPIATTTGDLLGQEDFSDNKKVIQGLYDAGFKNIDLSLYSLTPEHEYMQENWKSKILELKSFADSLGMKFVQAHSQGGNPLSSNQSEAQFIIDATIRSLEICEVLGIKNTVVHAGIDGSLNKQQWFEANKVFYDKLLPTAEKCKVNILCENSTSKNMGNAYYINKGSDMREFIKYINHPNFHGCWDTGHGNCEPNQEQNIKDLGDEMYAIHYSDNNGNADQHLMLCTGSINNFNIISALKSLGFAGYFTLECDSSSRNKYTYHGPDFNNNNKISDISLSSLSRLEQEKWLFKTASYLLDQKTKD